MAERLSPADAEYVRGLLSATSADAIGCTAKRDCASVNQTCSGTLSIGPMAVRASVMKRVNTSDPFGLFRVSITYNQQEEILVYPPLAALPEVDRQASARPMWREVAADTTGICVDDIHRNWRYGLNYYSVTPLPECGKSPWPARIEQTPGSPPLLKR